MSESQTAPRAAVLAAAAARVDAMIADTIGLVSVESPSRDLDAVARSADAVAALVRDRLGPDPERIVVDGCTHLRVRWGARADRVVLLAHHDTVWPIGTLERLPAAVTDGILRGPGCLDMKGGLVVAIHALAILRERDGDAALDGVELLVTGDEEIGSPSSRALIEESSRGAAAVLVLECGSDDGAFKAARKGVGMYRLEVAGRAAHAGLEPDRGANAAVAVSHAILEAAALHRSEPDLSVVPTVVVAGTTTNTVPAAASVALDVRAYDSAVLERVDAALRVIAPIVPDCEITLVGDINRPPLEAAASADLLALTDAICVDLGLDPIPGVAVGGASDGNFAAGVGARVLDGMGLVGGGAHAETEHVRVDAFAPRTAVVSELVRRVLGASA